MIIEKFVIEKNPTSLTLQWQEAGGGWSNNAIIKIFDNENDFLKGKKKIMSINQDTKTARCTGHGD